MLCYTNIAHLLSALSQSVHTVLLVTRTSDTLAMRSASEADLLHLIFFQT